MEDRLDKLEKLILAKNKETKERFDRFLTRNTEKIQQLQEDNFDMKSELTRNTEAVKWGRSDAKRVGKAVAGNEEHIQLVFENLNDQTRMINKKLVKLELGESN